MWDYGLGNMPLRRAATILSGPHAGLYVTDAGNWDPIVCAAYHYLGSGILGQTVLIKPVLSSSFPYGFDVNPP